MKTRRLMLKAGTALAAVLLTGPAFGQQAKPMPVVATFSILGDLVKQIGGEHVSVTTLVGLDGDTHVYQPTPADARAVSGAKILIVNGLEFEGWIDRLVEASGFKGMRVVTTEGVKAIPFEDNHADAHGDHKDDDHKDHGLEKHGDHKDRGHGHAKHRDHKDHGHGKHDDHKYDDHKGHGLAKHQDHKDHGHSDHNGEEHAKSEGHQGHDHGAFDPHAWQSLSNAVIYVDNIAAALSMADPSNAGDYFRNRAAYVEKIKALDTEIRSLVAGLPKDRRTVVTSHDAFRYFGRDYGLKFLAPQGVGTESEASAKDVARLIKQMRRQRISAVFIENVADARLLKQIATETKATIGGTLYPGALSGPDGPASTYLKMMRHNASTLATALGS